MSEPTTEIRPLDEETVARIAAGEVVERPASAVKELVENSLDADASEVSVTVEAGGTDLIRVVDDGHGMSEADLRAAVRQHTTSKIRDLADLESGVGTLGFRGEALHTIGSVAKLRLRSREAGADHGTELRYEGGEVVSCEPAGCPQGTSVEVTDLFYNTPARRKFLKTTATEFAHVNRIVTRYALANPEVAVSLTHDGRELFATTGQGDREAAMLAVYGREVAEAMIPVEEPDPNPGPVTALSGLVSHPETNRSTQEYMSTYVNGRAVTAEAVRRGICSAYEGQLGSDRYPFVALFLEVPGDAVDVNVHPRKREVRFDDADAVRRQVKSAVEEALLEHGLVRSRAPRGRSAPEEATVAPDRSSESITNRSSDAATEGHNSRAGSTNASNEPKPRDTAEPGQPAVADTEADQQAERTPPDEGDRTTQNEPAREREQTATRVSTDQADVSEATPASTTTHSAAESTADGESSTDREQTATQPTTEPGRESTEPTRKFDAATEQRTLAGEPANGATDFDSLPRLRVLGQLEDTYLVCESEDGLTLIDQHAADERVNYERLQTVFANDPPAQALASPVELSVTATEAVAFDHYEEALATLGFEAERIDDHTLAVQSVPAVFRQTLEPERLREVLTSVLEGDRDAGSEAVTALAEEFLADLACYPSITGNTSLTEGSVVDLLQALDDCENPYACPHGRPVLIQLDRAELEARFERDYPGHGG